MTGVNREFMKIGAMIRVFLSWCGLALVCVFLVSSTAQAQKPAGSMEDMKVFIESAGKCALDWLALVDAGEFGRSYDECASAAKSTTGREDWAKNLKAVREPLGPMISRDVYSVDYVTEIPDAPPGKYVIIVFASSFENKEQVFERVTPMLEKDGTWRVSGYYIF